MAKRGQTFEADFLHDARVWRTSFLWPRRSDILCRSRILPKVCSHELGKVIFFNFCDFHFSLTIFRTRFWPRDTCHVDVQQIRIEGLEKLICLGTKIFKIGPELRELWPWQWIFNKIPNADLISGLVNSWMEMCNGDFKRQFRIFWLSRP